MPYFCATAMTLSKSGSTGGGGFKGSSIVSQDSSKYFSMIPPGDCTISIRACVSPTFLNACGVPPGVKKDSPGMHLSRASFFPTFPYLIRAELWGMAAVVATNSET